MAPVKRKSCQSNFRSKVYLLAMTVRTARIVVVRAIHATRLTTGPWATSETIGVRAARSRSAGMAVVGGGWV